MTSKKTDTRKSKLTLQTREILKKLIKEEYRNISTIKEYGPNDFHPKDDLFRGFTFEDLITTIQSNESTINPQVVTKVFNEMYRANLQEALHELKTRMADIIKNSQ